MSMENNSISKLFIISLILFLNFGCISTQTEKEILPEYIILITLDGTGFDSLVDANTPIIDYLVKEENALFIDINTVCPSNTPNAHASLVTGKLPEDHNYSYEGDIVEAKTIFEIFEDNNYKTAIIDGKGGRIKGLERGVSYYIGDTDYRGQEKSNTQVMIKFIELFNEKKPTLSLILLPNIDHLGHKYGPNSKEYFGAIMESDEAILKLVNYLNQENLFEKTLIYIYADHGMSVYENNEYNHYKCTPTDMRIPLIRTSKNFNNNQTNIKSITDISKEILQIYNNLN